MSIHGTSITSKFQRVAPDDPNRCQASGANGQCPFRATGTRKNANSPWEGPSFCIRHEGGTKITARIESKRIYLASIWAAKIGEQANHPKIKSLREEMGVLRMMLNEKLSSLHDQQELLISSSAIVELSREIGKLAAIAHKIERDMGQFLDKTVAEAWVTDIIEIIGKFTDDSDILKAIAELVIESLDARTRPVDYQD